jgi:hypothetical protein
VTVANPDLKVGSRRRVHNAGVYHPARPDFQIRICHWEVTEKNIPVKGQSHLARRAE